MPIELPDRPRILVVALRRIGDVLLATPLTRSLRRAWPKATIEMLVFAGTAGIVEGNPDIDRVIVTPARPSAIESLRLLARLWKHYDLAISTQSGDRPTLFALVAGRTHAGLAAANGPRLASAIKRRALHRSTPSVESIHRVEQMLRLVDALGIERMPELVCPAAEAAPIAAGESYAVVHASPMFSYKQWRRESWRALAAGLERRGLAIVATSGPDPAERNALDELWQGIVPVRQLTWPQMVSLLARARLYIGPDTSVTHLAAATGCPTVTMFGPTDPRIWGPWPAGGLTEPWAASAAVQRRGNVWLVQNPLPCLPCQLEGCERHLASESACLDELTPEQVLSAVDQALGSLPRGEAVRASM